MSINRTEVVSSSLQAPPQGGPQRPLSEEIAAAAAGILERVLSQLLGRAYSPRIKLLNLRQVCQATGLGKTTIYALLDSGGFPKPQANLGKNMWRESTLISWADSNDPNQTN
jgi:predicted DNA-binding transcriptional regulator AlpA